MRAADDFATIRAHLERLRRAAQPAQPPAPGAGHRGPCGCGMSLFADECDGACKALDLGAPPRRRLPRG